MKQSEKELLTYIEEEDVKFIRLAFCDIYGVLKNTSVQPGELPRAFEQGIEIDASCISGFGGDYGEDIWLHPETDTISVLPWRPEHGKVVRMFCTLTYADGTPVQTDTRALLRQAVRYAEAKGYRFHFKSEIQFYLFKTDDKGARTSVPYDNAGYMDIAPADRGENVRREICLTLERMGILPEASHHESGPGQNEIDFRHADPLTAADNAVTFQAVVRTIAAQYGLWADFSPRPLPDKDGSGMHVNISASAPGIADSTPHLVAGILDRIPAMTLFLNPTENSYERLGRDKAPGFVAWSRENRSRLIRIPAAAEPFRRLELRSPDPSANPYLAFALVLRAGMEGLAQRKQPPAPTDDILPAGALPLPRTRDEAVRAALDSDFIRAQLPERIIRAYCR